MCDCCMSEEDDGESRNMSGQRAKSAEELWAQALQQMIGGGKAYQSIVFDLY
jgi:hypothetical protein